MRRPFVLFCLCSMLLAGVVSRVYLLDRSLWLDEAWVANSMRAVTLQGALYYAEWLQTTPPLFIALGRLFTLLFGTSNSAFRALPALAGIIAVLLFALIAFRLLRSSFALIAVLAFVISPRLILYSQSVKQYSTDVLCTTCLLLLGHVYLEKYSDRWFYFLLVGAVVLSFLSYPAMLFFPFVLICALTKDGIQAQASDRQQRTRFDLPRGSLAVAVAVVVLAANYFFFIAPNKNSALTEFFQEGFYQGNSPAEFLTFHGARLATLTRAFFFGGSAPLRLLTLLITVAGFYCLWMPLKNSFDVRTFQRAILFTAPMVGIVALNIVGFFPLPGFDHRIMLFAFPLTVLLFCLGLQFLANLAARAISARSRGVKAVSIENAFGNAVFFGMVVLVWLFFDSVGLTPFFTEEHEDSEEAVAYLSQQVEAKDILYVHTTMLEQFKLYTRTQPVAASRIVYGKIGMPCCPRSGYTSPRGESEKDISDEIFGLSSAAAGRLLWVLITNRGAHWFYMQRNDIDILERGLDTQGCKKLGEEKLTGVYVAKFACGQR